MVSVASKSASARSSNVIEVGPHPGGQTIFLHRPEFEVFFGGTAGPGKTWSLVYDALGLQYKYAPLGMFAIEEPKYRAVLFRRQTTELGKVIDEGKEMYCKQFGARFVYGRRGDPGPSFNFPSGARIFVSHMQHEKDKESHWGQEYQYVGFDELPQFTITQYLYLFARTRSTVEGLPPRIRSTGNPAGAGVIWVRRRFRPDERPYMPGHFLPSDDPSKDPYGKEVPAGTKFSKSRIFIPGYIHENPTLQDPEGYISQIHQLGRTWVRALLEHDWNAFSGEFFPQYDQSRMLIPPFAIPKQWPLYASLDSGAHCSFSLRAVDLDGTMYRVATYYETDRGPHDHADGAYEFVRECKWTGGRMPARIIAGRDAWAKRDRYAVISTDITWADIFGKRFNGVPLVQATMDRVLGWQTWKDMMERDKWRVFDILNQPLIDQMLGAPRDERQPEDIQGRGNSPEVVDHCLDDERYGVMAAAKPAKAPAESKSWVNQFQKKSKKGRGWKPGMT